MESSADIRRILTRLETLCPSGFAIAFHIRYARPDFLFQTYSKTWIDIYSQSGMVMHDPIVGWGFENTGTIRWSELRDDPMGVLEKSKPHGLVYGFACAVESDGSRSVAGCARADREFTDAEIAAIAADVQILHDETAKQGSLSEATREELRKMSVRFTHP